MTMLGPVTTSKSPSGAGTPTSKRPVENEDNNAQSAPFVIEDPANDDDDDAADMEDDGSGESKKAKKRVRYLRDTDRRNIIKRIENGEKQAALAREFGVTRAAICHIKRTASKSSRATTCWSNLPRKCTPALLVLLRVLLW